jgi:hypothetical protein
LRTVNSYHPLQGMSKVHDTLSFKDINPVDITDNILSDLVMKGFLKNDSVIYDYLFEVAVDVRT